MMANEDEETVLRMRGLPWSATAEDILKFFDGTNVKNGSNGIHMTTSREGRPSGEAFVELESPEDVKKALSKDKQHMGHRYIEIFPSSYSEMELYLNKSGSNTENILDECCVRLRGLPYGCMKDDIVQFFSGLTIVPNGISFVSDHTGRSTGEAYVQFINKEMVESALKKHLDKIGHRYIEIFRSSLREVEQHTSPKIRPLMSEFIPRPTPYDRSERYSGMNRFNRGSQGPASRLRDSYDDDYDYSSGWTARKLGPVGSKPPSINVGGFGNSVNSGRNKFVVRMRGLPFRASEQDILDFFVPHTPIDVHIIYERSGRPSGEAEVEFSTYDDAQNAMEKDKQNMNNRYIELFLRAKPPNESYGSLANNTPMNKGFSNNSNQLFSRRSTTEDNSNINGISFSKNIPPWQKS